MVTAKLDKPLKRELMVLGHPYIVTLSPDGVKLVPKGRRKGYELDWESFVSGYAALAVALNATLARAPVPRHAVCSSNTSAKRRQRR
jgi:hypothetical protein